VADKFTCNRLRLKDNLDPDKAWLEIKNPTKTTCEHWRLNPCVMGGYTEKQQQILTSSIEKICLFCYYGYIDRVSHTKAMIKSMGLRRQKK